MKLHKPLLQAVVVTMQQIFEKHIYADKAVANILIQNPKWGAKDRRFIAETIYDMVRWYRLYMQINNLLQDGVENNYYRVFAIHYLLRYDELPGWNEFTGINKDDVLRIYDDIKNVRKYKASVPDWLDELGVKELGEKVWTNELTALNETAQVVLRVNTLKTNKLQLQRLLTEANIETSIIGDYEDALLLLKRQNLNNLAEYKNGLFEVQDASSQLIAPFLKVSEGMTVIDACSGAGGKALHIAAMMKNKGNIICMDVEPYKLKELEKRSGRAGATIIKTKLIDPGTIQQYKNKADRLLLDVPCSGLGVLRRNPDAKWKLNLDFIEKIKQTQQEIISSYSTMLKPGGMMVYATCSILPGENQNQVQAFLNKHKNEFIFLEDKKIMPSDWFDGFYMAAVQKKHDGLLTNKHNKK